MQRLIGAAARKPTSLLWCGAICLLCYGARTLLSHIEILSFGSQGLVSLVLLLIATAAPLVLGFAWWRGGPDLIRRRDARLTLFFAMSFGLLCIPAVPKLRLSRRTA